jgi:hypothetical protein
MSDQRGKRTVRTMKNGKPIHIAFKHTGISPYRQVST